MRPKTIKAMSGDIIDVIPPEIMQILKYYSLEIANEIQSDWKIFSDSDPNISY